MFYSCASSFPMTLFLQVPPYSFSCCITVVVMGLYVVERVKVKMMACLGDCGVGNSEFSCHLYFHP